MFKTIRSQKKVDKLLENIGFNEQLTLFCASIKKNDKKQLFQFWVTYYAIFIFV